VVVDLGCGTGQLTVPLAARVRAVIGVDPSPDMLSRARREAPGSKNAVWFLGADTDLPHLANLLGERSVAAITIGQALHWMDHETLFRAVKPLLRPGGGIAVVTNGTPLWWSRGRASTTTTTSASTRSSGECCPPCPPTGCLARASARSWSTRCGGPSCRTRRTASTFASPSWPGR
jgi:SAM-dependent methyltransferase